MNVKRKITISVTVPVTFELMVVADVGENPTTEELEAADWEIVTFHESGLATIGSGDVDALRELMTAEDFEALVKAAAAAPTIDEPRRAGKR